MSLLLTADGGKSWQSGSLGLRSPTAPYGTSLSCPSATVCYFAGTAFSPVQATGQTRSQALLLVTKDSGKSWPPLHLPDVKSLSPRALACLSVMSCDVGGVIHEKSCYQAGVILHTADGGRTWVRQFGDCASAVSALACPAPGFCYAGGWFGAPDADGNQLILHSDDGSSWNDQFEGPIDPAYDPGNSFSAPISGIACPDTQTCFLSAGNHILSTRDGGAIWSVQTPAASVFLTAIACPTPSVCVSVGWLQPVQSAPGPQQTKGVIVRTVDGGKTWTRV